MSTTTAATPVGTGHPLSAHEHRIAVLAAAGRSNQEIGDGLGVCSRAIEHHLTRVYEKLCIRGRRQIGAALSSRPRPVRPRVRLAGQAG